MALKASARVISTAMTPARGNHVAKADKNVKIILYADTVNILKNNKISWKKCETKLPLKVLFFAGGLECQPDPCLLSLSQKYSFTFLTTKQESRGARCGENLLLALKVRMY